MQMRCLVSYRRRKGFLGKEAILSWEGWRAPCDRLTSWSILSNTCCRLKRHGSRSHLRLSSIWYWIITPYCLFWSIATLSSSWQSLSSPIYGSPTTSINLNTSTSTHPPHHSWKYHLLESQKLSSSRSTHKYDEFTPYPI